jgi:hypothetical protein
MVSDGMQIVIYFTGNRFAIFIFYVFFPLYSRESLKAQQKLRQIKFSPTAANFALQAKARKIAAARLIEALYARESWLGIRGNTSNSPAKGSARASTT